MGYTTGVQGPTSVQAIQGPTDFAGSPHGLWGAQGPISGKHAPFLNYPVNNEFLVTSATLELQYTLASGNKYGIYITRTIQANQFLQYFPDDVVQMTNLIDFTPRPGIFQTQGSQGASYTVVDIGPIVNPTLNLTSPTTSSNYVSSELSL